jgi:PIN domain nuclease of toxin-antitoxin system
MPADSRQVLLDTHALLWWAASSTRLSATAAASIAAAPTIFISPVTCWEVAMLVVKERVKLDRPTAAWVRDLLAKDRVETAALGPSAAVAAAELPGFHGDPADRQLYATARSLDAVMLTKDQHLHRYAAERGDLTVRW